MGRERQGTSRRRQSPSERFSDRTASGSSEQAGQQSGLPRAINAPSRLLAIAPSACSTGKDNVGFGIAASTDRGGLSHRAAEAADGQRPARGRGATPQNISDTLKYTPNSNGEKKGFRHNPIRSGSPSAIGQHHDFKRLTETSARPGQVAGRVRRPHIDMCRRRRLRTDAASHARRRPASPLVVESAAVRSLTRPIRDKSSSILLANTSRSPPPSPSSPPAPRWTPPWQSSNDGSLPSIRGSTAASR